MTKPNITVTHMQCPLQSQELDTSFSDKPMCPTIVLQHNYRYHFTSVVSVIVIINYYYYIIILLLLLSILIIVFITVNYCILIILITVFRVPILV